MIPAAVPAYVVCIESIDEGVELKVLPVVGWTLLEHLLAGWAGQTSARSAEEATYAPLIVPPGSLHAERPCEDLLGPWALCVGHPTPMWLAAVRQDLLYRTAVDSVQAGPRRGARFVRDGVEYGAGARDYYRVLDDIDAGAWACSGGRPRGGRSCLRRRHEVAGRDRKRGPGAADSEGCCSPWR